MTFSIMRKVKNSISERDIHYHRPQCSRLPVYMWRYSIVQCTSATVEWLITEINKLEIL